MRKFGKQKSWKGKFFNFNWKCSKSDLFAAELSNKNNFCTFFGSINTLWYHFFPLNLDEIQMSSFGTVRIYKQDYYCGCFVSVAMNINWHQHKRHAYILFQGKWGQCFFKIFNLYLDLLIGWDCCFKILKSQIDISYGLNTHCLMIPYHIE